MKLGKNKKDNASKPEEKNDDFLAQEAKEMHDDSFQYTLDIPEDEIWTYQIEGLQKPHVNQPFDNAKVKKIVVVIVLLIAIGTAIFFSVRAVHSDEYKYKQLEDGTYELVKYSNPGSVDKVTIDYVVDKKTGEKDTSKPITVINEYAFNCDEILREITIGKDVREIDGKSIYSCWWLQNVFVDKENQSYCDIDGVIYNKDVTEIIFYPNDHDKYLRLKTGYAELDSKGEIRSKLVDDDGKEMEELWGTTKNYNEAYFQKYNRDVRTYVVPSTVTKIGQLAFAYSNIVDLYIPEGVKTMESMAVFKNSVLLNIFSYKTDSEVTDTTYKGIDSMSEIYDSLPDGLEYIGSDCFYYERGLTYMYIPDSVTEIGHHAFWDVAYKEDNEIKGLAELNCASTEENFDANCKTGDQWRAQYDYMLFKKSIPVNFSAERQSQKSNNIHREYYWSVQWIINNCSEEVKNNSLYLVKDFDNDGTPELVLREYNEETKKTTDTILTIEYNYLEKYKGYSKYSADEMSKLDDNAQLDAIFDMVK